MDFPASYLKIIDFPKDICYNIKGMQPNEKRNE